MSTMVDILIGGGLLGIGLGLGIMAAMAWGPIWAGGVALLLFGVAGVTYLLGRKSAQN